MTNASSNVNVKALEDRRASMAIVSSVLDAVSSCILVLDASRRVLHANAQAKDLLGHRLPTGLPLEEVLENIDLTVGTGDHKVSKEDGTAETVIRYACRSITIDSVDRLIVTLHDEREVNRLRHELRGLEALSDVGKMSASIAHEIRNPLAGLLAILQAFEADAEEAGLSEPFETMKGEILRLVDLMQGLFSYVRWTTPNRRLTNMEEIYQRVLSVLRPSLGQTNVELRVQNLAPMWLDPNQIHQLLANLLANANDAVNASGNILVEMALSAGQFELNVEDNGCGVPDAQKERIFDAFYSTKHHGVGLGLAVCRRVVDAHGGTIRVIDGTMGGTRIEARLPMLGTEKAKGS
ncbi:MAG: PAS domain-containing protein [Deltaproteobacteria bacterium]|nr:PAS domain-containing protein [Deltaproteobacteria bacterium]